MNSIADDKHGLKFSVAGFIVSSIITVLLILVVFFWDNPIDVLVAFFALFFGIMSVALLTDAVVYWRRLR